MTHPLIAREGWAFCVLAVVAAITGFALGGPGWGVPLSLIAIFVLQFFRDPGKTLPDEPDAVICPAHGKVVYLGPHRDPYHDRDALKISIFMNVFSIHSNWTPVAGEIRGRSYHPGKFLNAALDKSSQENERNAILIRTPQGFDVACVQIAGLVARRILCYVEEGDRVGAGERYGFIRFGSRVDVYLPPDSRPTVTLNQWVMSGSDIIAQLPQP